MALLVLLMGLSAPMARAWPEGASIARFGLSQMAPRATGGQPGAAGLDVRPKWRFSGGLTLMLSERVALDVPVVTAYKLDLEGRGAWADLGVVGQAKLTPVSLLVQYRLGTPGSRWRPYLGAGVTYARLSGAQPSPALAAAFGTAALPLELHTKSAWGTGVQWGVAYALSSRWSVEAHWHRVQARTQLSASGSVPATVRISPQSLSFSLGSRF